LHGVAQATDCAICHNYTGLLLDKAIVLTAIRQGLNGTPISCLDCHTDKASGHGNFPHPIEVGPADLSYNSPGQLCSDCHVVSNWSEIESIEHNVDTNGAGSCATCHNSTRPEVQNVIADAPNYGGYPIHCLACHPDKDLTPHGSVDHVAAGIVTGGSTSCLNCHDPGEGENATITVTHNNDCAHCHTSGSAVKEGLEGAAIASPATPATGRPCIR